MQQGMRVVEFIARQRDGRPPRPDDLRTFIAGVTDGSIPDYQIAAWLMAVVWRGLDDGATADLTAAMAASGTQMRLRDRLGVVVDKHSTGGVGDKVSLAVVPLIAACGVPVAKMAGRGLGHTGGTIDKLEAIPGFHTDLDAATFADQVARIGLAIAAPSADLAPADGRLYALRDVTATVPSIPLIAASVMSKKLAVGPSHLLLDVKVGPLAFMTTTAAARTLARLMVALGTAQGVRTAAVLTSMQAPLGRAIGNALEVAEAIDVLHGGGPEDVAALCRHAAATLLWLAGAARDPQEAAAQVATAIASGAALAKFRALIAAQGGDPAVVDDPARRLPQAPVVRPVLSPLEGRVNGYDAISLARALITLRAGREHQGDAIDPATGIVLAVGFGDPVQCGQPLAWMHARDEANADAAQGEVVGMFGITPPPVPVRRWPLIIETIGG